MKLTYSAFLAMGAALLLAGTVSGAPCMSTSDCSEWIGSGSTRVLVYRSFPLESTNPDITRAIIVVHGGLRDGDYAFRDMLAAAFLGEALENTVVIAPRFASNNGSNCADKLAELEARWQCGGPARWSYGGGAVDNPAVTTFDIMDELLLKLSRRDAFPSLRSIALVGHSAGGMFVNRYEMANQVHDKLTIPLSYVVSNPSTYGYLDAMRPSVTMHSANVWALGAGDGVALPETPPAPFIPFADAQNCTTFDQWPYGLKDRVGYSAKLTDEQLQNQTASRPMTYLLGGFDTLTIGGFDRSCAGMAQGPTRTARGLAWATYINDNFGANHEVRVVPTCGHNSRCMFTDDAAVDLLFSKL